jgi:hypothetical protein
VTSIHRWFWPLLIMSACFISSIIKFSNFLWIFSYWLFVCHARQTCLPGRTDWVQYCWETHHEQLIMMWMNYVRVHWLSQHIKAFNSEGKNYNIPAFLSRVFLFHYHFFCLFFILFLMSPDTLMYCEFLFPRME